MKKILILGYGYVARHLKDYLKIQEPDSEVITTSRTDKQHCIFNLEDSKTWNHLPNVDETFWTFPATSLELTKLFLQEKSKSLGKLVIIGSTSGFLVEENGQMIHENSKRDFTRERVCAEEWVRNHGGSVICASGIYGPGKHPKDWLIKGLVSPSEKLVNLIHVDDLVQILFKAMKKGRAGSLYLASDENTYSWKQIHQFLQSQQAFSLPSSVVESKGFSKVVNSSKTIKELGVQLKHPSFISG